MDNPKHFFYFFTGFKHLQLYMTSYIKVTDYTGGYATIMQAIPIYNKLEKVVGFTNEAGRNRPN